MKKGEIYRSVEDVNEDVRQDLIDEVFSISPRMPPFTYRRWYHRVWDWVRSKMFGFKSAWS